MRKIGFLSLLIVVCLSAFAAPARKGWVTRTLADGTSVEVQHRGDEYYHYFETRDGKLLKETEKGLVISEEPVPTSAQVAERRAQRAPKAVGRPNLAPRGLVILAGFADLPIASYNTSESIDSMMNVSGYDYHGSTGSARDYFIAQSDSQYMPVFDVVGPVTLPQNRAFYGSGYPDANPKQMIVDACRLVDDVVDFTQYNNDNNTDVDFVYVIYAGIGENDRDGVSDAVWAHNGHASDKNCIVDGLRVNNYACSGDIDGVTKDRNGIGVLCHEFGHVIGLPDYYSTSTGVPVFAEWSIMDYGCYNNDALTPPNYSIFDKYFMGWATPKLLAKDEQHYVRMGTDYNDAYQITGGSALLPYSTTNTVYYIENRQNTGWDTYLPGHGMIVWRVIFSQSVWNSNKVNYTTNSPRYTVFSAQNGLMVDGNEVWSTAADPFPGTGVFTTYTPFEGCALTDISEAYGQIKFKYNGGKTICEYLVMSEHCTVSSEEGTLSSGDTLMLTVTPDAGYRLDPDCWAVEMGSINPLLEYGVDYTYDAQTGELVIANVTDDVVVLVEAKVDTGTSLPCEEVGVKSAKMLKNGQLVILRGDKQYNAQGIEIH